MRGWIVAISWLGLVVTTNVAHAEQRIAFVVGNGAYTHMKPRDNARADARSMAELLRKAGFTVIEGTDLAGSQLRKELIEFGSKAEGADLAVFYYAGQSVSMNGVAYLLPTDANIQTEMDLKLGNAISLNDAVDQAMIGAKTKLVFFDASQKPADGKSDPAALTPAMNTDHGLLIAYAAGPGQTALDGAKGKHSPFTQALLENIAVPGVEIQQAMSKVRAQVNDMTDKQQQSWGHTALDGEVYLTPAADDKSKVAKKPD